MIESTQNVLRCGLDIGLLTNVRMSVEIATAVAYLTGRRLSMPFETPIGQAPQSSISDNERGRGATVADLLELPVPMVHPDEWTELGGSSRETVDWGEIGTAVCLVGDHPGLDDPQLAEFRNGRTRTLTVPDSASEVLELDGRLLSFYSYFFHGRPADLRQLHALIRGVQPRRPFRELGVSIAADLGRYNAVHLRRSDLVLGIPAYGEVTPQHVAENLASILARDESLLVCSEVDGSDELFDPLRQRFTDVTFANDVILGDHRDSFFALPRHEDNALGLITQQVASRARQFVGTIGSTFTAMIQRERGLREPGSPFLYTADFTPDGPVFVNGEFQEIAEGAYTWNRIRYAMSPDVLAWFREWPEAT